MGSSRSLLLCVGLCLVPFSASALELVTPEPTCTLSERRVTVIGKGAKPAAGQGTLEWEGGTAPISAWAGRFYLSAELPAGNPKAKIVFGKETLELKWTVGPSARPFVYHPRVAEQDCKGCHDPESPPVVGQDVSKICYSCHTRYTARSSVHGPTAGGFCTACHDPHGSSQPALLKYATQELCNQCHNRPITDEHQKIKEETPCMDCHDPHGSNRNYNLKRR